MKLLVKPSFTIFLLFFLVGTGYAQSKKQTSYNTIVIAEGQRFSGKITAINETELIVEDKKAVSKRISYEKISSIKVFKRHSDVGYAIITGALAAGTIVAGQTGNDANTAMLVGVGGTVAVVSLSMILHNVIHGPEVKMKASKEKINYKTVSEKLNKYAAAPTETKL